MRGLIGDPKRHHVAGTLMGLYMQRNSALNNNVTSVTKLSIHFVYTIYILGMNSVFRFTSFEYIRNVLHVPYMV